MYDVSYSPSLEPKLQFDGFPCSFNIGGNPIESFLTVPARNTGCGSRKHALIVAIVTNKSWAKNR